MMTTTERAARSWHEHGTVAVLTTEGSVRLVLSGPIDQLCSGDLNEAVKEAIAAGLPVEIDTRNVTFMDSSVVVALHTLSQACPLRATFIKPTDLVRFLLQVTHLGDSVKIT